MYAKLPVQRLGIIADNIKTAAFHWALWSEGADDHMASGLDRVGDLANLGDTVARRCKKMKDSAVVPHIASRGPQFSFSDFCDEPMNMLRRFP